MKDYELINWLTTIIHKDIMIFDKIYEFETIINRFLSNNKLELNVEKNAFLIRFIVFLYNNSNNNTNNNTNNNHYNTLYY